MRSIQSALRIGLWLTAAAGASWALGCPQGDGATSGSATFEPHAVRTWDIVLPEERFPDLGAGVVLPHDGGDRFAAVDDGGLLKVDINGDGTPEARVEGTAGHVTFSAKTKEGAPLSYSVRLTRMSDGPWKYGVGGVMSGMVDGVQVRLIDQNLNGSFNDVGEDAIVVGRENVASYLSSAINVNGKLYAIEVARDGAKLSWKPFEGATAKVDFTGSFTCKALLRAAIVKSADGKFSFNVSKSAGGMLVPAGDYTLTSGQLALHDSVATLKRGRSKPFAVKAGETFTPKWGGPVTAEFGFSRMGDKLVFTPWDIWYYGELGEEYSNFLPLGTSPEFTIKKKEGGETIAVAKFPGNC